MRLGPTCTPDDEAERIGAAIAIVLCARRRSYVAIGALLLMCVAGCSGDEHARDAAGTSGAGAGGAASSAANGPTTNGVGPGGATSGVGAGGAEPCALPDGYALDLSIMVPSNGSGMRDLFVDAAGDVYMAGGTVGVTFPITNGSIVGGPNGRGDVLVLKFASTGELAWSTVIGSTGDGDEYAYAIEVSEAGDVYVAGRASVGLPTTAGAMQPTFAGYAQGSHGQDNAFLAKLDGSGAVQALTYFGTAPNIRDLTIDPTTGDVLVATQYNVSEGQSPMPAGWFAQAAQPVFGGAVDGVVARVASDLSHVIWATYVGGSGVEEGTGSVRLDAAGNVFYATNTTSTDLPVTANALQKASGGAGDLLLAKYTPAGALVYLTYYGGSGNESTETHNLGVAPNGEAYLIGQTKSGDCATTAGVVQPAHAGSSADTDYVIAKISPDGSQLLAATYLGSPGWEGVGSIAVDASGLAYVSGASGASFPVTADAYQGQPAGATDVVFAVISPALDEIVYATYFGGSGDTSRGDAIDVNPNGQVAFRFADDSTDVPIQGSPWPTYRGPGSAFARFSRQCGPSN